jgi:ATP-dependent helicase/nuclease subunit A
MTLADARERREAASRLDRNLVVTAGAGTGKTSLLVERLLHQVLGRGVPLRRLAAITFTNKAAAEMRERLEDGLERAAALASGEGEAAEANEADRVLDELGAEASEAVLARSHAALDELDQAAVSTIHSFAADLLRRRHREAGVDIDFEVDEDGSGASALFEELWAAHVEKAFAAEVEDPAWGSLLGKLSMEDVEGLARKLAEFQMPLEAIGPGALEAQKHHARLHAQELLGELERLRAAIAGAAGINRNLPGVLERLEEVFRRFEAGEDLEASPSGLPSSKCTIGKNAVLPRAKETEKLLNGLIRQARSLSACDFQLARELGTLLTPFIEEFRREYLRRGFISHDALIILARNLLRDHPAARREEAERYDQLLVDEFQDTDPLQYEIVFYLAAKPESAGLEAEAPADAFSLPLEPGKLFIVGDAKQSIYRFRGADIDAYRRAVTAVCGGGKPLALRSNFRSVPELVEPLNDLFREYFEPAPPGGEAALDPEYDALVPSRPAAGEPRIEILSAGRPGMLAGERRELEAEAIASRIHALCASAASRPRDVAILLRVLTHVDVLLRSLRRWGLPYIVEGGKGFYARHEVALLLALLRAAASPSDPVALIGYLRSPMAAVPDRELQLFATELKRSGRSWALSERPAARECPRLAAALEQLRDFAARRLAEPIDRLARAALDEIPLRLAMAASYEGAQRAANLEKAVRRIGELARDGRLDAEEILERIEEEEARERAEGDSPLADETVDAVRVLTIHKAKGLEWPIVFVPELARECGAKPAGGSTAAAFGAGALCALALEAGKLRTPACLRYLEREGLQGAAEAKRLFYVAATRARERLFLVAGPPQKGKMTWLEPLGAWGYRLDGGSAEAAELAGGRVLHRRLEEKPAAPPAARSEELHETLRRAAGRFLEAQAQITTLRDWLRSPSSADGDCEPPRRRSAAAQAHGRAAMQAAGSAFHLLLELWDRSGAAWLLERAEKAAAVAAAARGLEPAAVLPPLREMLEAARASGALARIAELPVLARELPVLYLDGDGIVWKGTIDLVAGAPERPEIIDFKSEAGSAAELAARHAAQLERYAEALRRALELEKPLPARIEPLGGAAAGP